jgi:Fe2+ transport system protein B
MWKVVILAAAWMRVAQTALPLRKYRHFAGSLNYIINLKAKYKFPAAQILLSDILREMKSLLMNITPIIIPISIITPPFPHTSSRHGA